MQSGRYAPFKAHKKHSVKACGSVSEVRIHEDGKTAQVTVRHKAPEVKRAKKGGEGQAVPSPYEYPEETRAIMPAEFAKRFAAGQVVTVHIGPANEVGDDESPSAEKAEHAGNGKRKPGDLIRMAAAKGAAKAGK